VQPGRSGLVTWWDDDEALDAFLATDGGSSLSDGWSVRLRPTRSRAVWPKFDGDPFPQPNERHDGIHTAITLGSSRPARLRRFLNVTGKLNEQFQGNRDGIWGTGFTLPPLIAMTMTFWTDQDAVDAYTRSGAHGAAMKAHYDFPTDRHDFVSDGGFYGFQPYGFVGRLTGINPTHPMISGPLS